MRLLLDTNIAIYLSENRKLSLALQNAIIDSESLWLTSLARAEIGIKMSVGKLRLEVSEPEYWTRLQTRLQASELAFESKHAALLATMPLNHRDPFDRMIAAQCLAEDLTLATTDTIFNWYGVRTIS